MANEKKQVGVGIIGYGTVGAGVAQGLLQNHDLMLKRTGVSIELKKIADLDIESDRGVNLPAGILTKSSDELINDPGIDIVVELVGGTTFAKALTIQALEAGKSVVTANKALLAEHGNEIFSVAKKNNSEIYYEASIAGGIPIVKCLREGFVGNHIDSIYGIFNGTCNYILTRMEDEGILFDDVLAQAQEAGYAEADPTLDVDGFDTAHKICLLANLAFGKTVAMEEIRIEGIRGISMLDLKFAKDAGYAIKLLAVLKHSEQGLDVRVHPTLIPDNHLLSSVRGPFNAAFVRGDLVGDTMFYGAGAGRLPTASAVISDIADVALNLSVNAKGRLPSNYSYGESLKLVPLDEGILRFYLRLQLKDEAGAMAKVSDVLAEFGISIASVIQHEEHEENSVPVIYLTQPCQESAFNKALDKIRELEVVTAEIVRYIIDDFS